MLGRSSMMENCGNSMSRASNSFTQRDVRERRSWAINYTSSIDKGLIDERMRRVFYLSRIELWLFLHYLFRVLCVLFFWLHIVCMPSSSIPGCVGCLQYLHNVFVCNESKGQKSGCASVGVAHWPGSCGVNKITSFRKPGIAVCIRCLKILSSGWGNLLVQ